MENQDDAIYCKLLSEILENCEKQLEKETLEFNGYMKEREEQEKYIREAIAEEYNKVLNKVQQSYEALVEHSKKELDRALLQYRMKTELSLDEKMNRSLRDMELELQAHYDKIVQQNDALDRQYDKERYEVDKLRLELLNISTEIHRLTKPIGSTQDKIIFEQFHVDQIKNKNQEIIELYDRLSQNLQNKITQIEEDIERMEHLCNYLLYDDVKSAKNIGSNEAVHTDIRAQPGVENRTQHQDITIDYEAID